SRHHVTRRKRARMPRTQNSATILEKPHPVCYRAQNGRPGILKRRQEWKHAASRRLSSVALSGLPKESSSRDPDALLDHPTLTLRHDLLGASHANGLLQSLQAVSHRLEGGALRGR